MSNKQKLSGIFAPINTPFINDDLKLDDLKFNLDFYGKSKLKGYLALGSNGEFRSLTDKEQLQVLELFAEKKGDKIIMVGTACESTRETISKSKIVEQMGFDFASVLTPGYFAKFMDGDKLQSHFERIADAATIPILIYNAPQFTGGVQIPVKTLCALSKHPNIVGIKDSSSNGPAKYLNVLDPDEDFHVLAGSSSTFYQSLFLGARGGIISLANVFPDIVAELYEAWLKGNQVKALDIHFRLNRLTTAVSGSYGVSGVKAAMNIVGLKGDEPRLPMMPVTTEGIKIIREAMEKDGFI